MTDQAGMWSNSKALARHVDGHRKVTLLAPLVYVLVYSIELRSSSTLCFYRYTRRHL